MLTTATVVGNAEITNQNAAPDAARPMRSDDCSRSTRAARAALPESLTRIAGGERCPPSRVRFSLRSLRRTERVLAEPAGSLGVTGQRLQFGAGADRGSRTPHVERAVHRPFVDLRKVARHARDTSRDAQHLVLEAVGGKRAVREPDALGLDAVDRITGQDELHRAA